MELSPEKLSEREQEILALLAEGAADKEIAARLHLSLNTVKWHNRQIYAKLDVGSRTEAVAAARERGLLGEKADAPAERASRVPHNLPAPVSSFVGREKEIAEILDLLKDHRLVTLTGPGGVGKTRLALEVARELLKSAAFPEGIHFVELAPLQEPKWVGEAVLESIGLRAEENQSVWDRLGLFLENRSLLLILDNFEHLLEAPPLIGQVLEECANLWVLATSREELRLSGEQLYPLSPLEIPASVILFVQRAQEVRPDFQPDESDMDLVGQICQELDGLPLAVELSAARVQALGLRELRDRLEDRFQMLNRGPRDAPERHRSLQATIEWSYHLLEEEDQILFRRLAVFQGGCTIDAVQDVCCFNLGLDALDGLESLLNKSLLKHGENLDGETRFYMLETIRAYALEQLQESGEERIIQERHVAYFLLLAEGLHEAHWHNKNVVIWIQKALGDLENLRLAQVWAVSLGLDLIRLKFIASLFGFWFGLGRANEMREWIEQALEIADQAPQRLRARIYRIGAIYCRRFGDYARSRQLYAIALALFQELGETYYLGSCHLDLTRMLIQEGNVEQELILEKFHQAMEYFLEAEDQVAISEAWEVIAAYYQQTGNQQLAYQNRKKALALAQESGHETAILGAKAQLAYSELEMGNPGLAKEIFLEILSEESAHFQYHLDIEGTFEHLAGPELALGHPGRAVTLLSVGNALRKRKGFLFYHHGQEQRINQRLKLSAEQLDQAAHDAAWEKGQKMSFEEALAFAFETGHDSNKSV